MYPDELALLRAVCERPGDDAPRLAFADWLDEHDRPARAGLIRSQVALANCGPPPKEVVAAQEPWVIGKRRRTEAVYEFRSTHGAAAAGDRIDLVYYVRGGHKVVAPGLDVVHVQTLSDNLYYSTRYVARRDEKSGPWPGREHEAALNRLAADPAALPATALFAGPAATTWFRTGDVWALVSSCPLPAGCDVAASLRRGFYETVFVPAWMWHRVAPAVYWHPAEGRPFPPTSQPITEVVINSFRLEVGHEADLEWARAAVRDKYPGGVPRTHESYTNGRFWLDALSHRFPHLTFKSAYQGDGNYLTAPRPPAGPLPIGDGRYRTAPHVYPRPTPGDPT